MYTAASPSFTPESEQRLPCNLALLMHIHELGSKWDLAEKAWHSGLVQAGSVLEWKRRPHYVVRSYSNGLLLWPLSGHRDDRLTFDKGVRTLSWGFLFSLEDTRVETDDRNGRWKLTHKIKGARQQKSVSWTQAGHKSAAAYALSAAWKWHTEHSGDDMPAGTKKLVVCGSYRCF